MLYRNIKREKKKWITQALDLEKVQRYLVAVPVYSKSVVLYNDLGYFFEQAGDHRTAVYVLESVVSEYPKREVAYINLGDAYWWLNDKMRAKKAYEKYVELMKESGKEAKIPVRVWERIDRFGK